MPSPFLRTCQTCQPLAKAMGAHARVVVNPDIYENGGVYVGHLNAEGKIVRTAPGDCMSAADVRAQFPVRWQSEQGENRAHITRTVLHGAASAVGLRDGAAATVRAMVYGTVRGRGWCRGTSGACGSMAQEREPAAGDWERGRPPQSYSTVEPLQSIPPAGRTLLLIPCIPTPRACLSA